MERLPQTRFTAMRAGYRRIGRHSLEFFQGLRDRFRDHPWFRDCAEFCEKYDQNSFDPGYDTLPLETFEPALRSVFAAPRKSIYVPESAA